VTSGDGVGDDAQRVRRVTHLDADQDVFGLHPDSDPLQILSHHLFLPPCRERRPLWRQAAPATCRITALERRRDKNVEKTFERQRSAF